MIVEFTRNVLGFRDADHAETSPDADRLVITPLACSLVGQQGTVAVRPGTLAGRLYGTAEATEDYYCSYGVNPEYRPLLEKGGLSVSGLGGAAETRIATLFLPQARSRAGAPHPLLAGYAAAVRRAGGDRR